MCVLKRTRKSPEEVAQWFRADIPRAFNMPLETHPGTPGLAVVEHEGVRQLRSMVWGFPLLTAAMRKRGSKPKPINQAADLTLPMWRRVAPDPAHRCLIPITDFAEPEGRRGAMTRTWFSVTGQPLIAWAGLWRSSHEWGNVYAGVTTAANEAIKPIQDRMPVLLLPDDYERWLSGTIDDVIAFQARTFPPELIHIDHTDEPWTERKMQQTSDQPALL